MIYNFMTSSRVTEVDAGAMRLIGAYKNTALSGDVHLAAMFTTLETQTARFTSAINRSKAESDLEEKDEVRDNKVRALYYLVMGLLHHPDAEIKAAARAVEKVFDKYGLAITGESYASESALVGSLLDDLTKPKLQEAIAKLSGVSEIIAELDAAQSSFETSRIAYEEEKAKEGTQENATLIKKEVLDLINGKLIIYLRAMELVDKPVYGEFARTVAVIINENNEAVKKRLKKNKKSKRASGAGIKR
jgi:hypothetical protein